MPNASLTIDGTEVISKENGIIDINNVNRLTFDEIATGGIRQEYYIDDVLYVSHTFLSNGIFTLNKNNIAFDYLVIGGGGGGGCGFSKSASGGGGGAGAFIEYITQTISSGSYNVVIGNGGNGGVPGAGQDGALNRTSPHSGDGQFGEDSSVFGTISKGGGGGTTYTDHVGWSNGISSGGGNGGAGNGAQNANSVRSTAGIYGNSGGLLDGTGQSNDTTSCGGGGGAGGQGGDGRSSRKGGNGGIGATNSFRDGIVRYYAAGGGGGSVEGGQAKGGLGGGGDAGEPEGGSGGNHGYNGMPNTGSGGGGGSSGDRGVNGGNGGSGIVIIRYQKHQ